MGGIYSKVVNDFGQRRVVNYNARPHSGNHVKCQVCKITYHPDNQSEMNLCEYCQIEICDNCETSCEPPYNNYILCPTCYTNLYLGKRMPRSLTRSRSQPKTEPTPSKSESSDILVSESDDLVTCEYCNNQWDGHAQCRCGGNETATDDL